MIAVLGATGKVGRATITKLRQEGVPVRAVVRDPVKAGDLSLGPDIAVADLEDTRSVRAAIESADAVQVIGPTYPYSTHASAGMLRTIESIAAALSTCRTGRGRSRPLCRPAYSQLCIDGTARATSPRR